MVETAQYDPIVVEPELTVEKVEELVTRGQESAKLDYKSKYDPSDSVAKVKLVKHVLAMANTAGGYLVIGVDDDGTVEGLTADEAKAIDEATVRSQVHGYCEGRSIALFVNKGVKHKGKRFAILTVLPVTSGPIVASADGNYPTGGSPAFRKGDVLVRHGSQSERWTQADADFIMRRTAESQKEVWIREFAGDLRRLIQVAVGRPPADIDERIFDLPPEEFQKAIVNLFPRST